MNSTFDFCMFNGFRTIVPYCELSEKDQEILEGAIMLIDNKWSLRKLALNVGRSRSFWSRHFRKTLPYLSDDLTLQVFHILRHNKIKYFPTSRFDR